MFRAKLSLPHFMTPTFMLPVIFSSTNVLALDPAPVPMGPIDFIPTLDIDIENNDNIYYRSENETSSAIYIIRPDFLFSAKNNLDTYDARIFFESGTVASSERGDDDYLDAGIHLDGHWEFNDKNRLDALVHFDMEHDPRGDAFSAGTSTVNGEVIELPDAFVIKEVDTYQTSDIGLTYELGLGNTNTGFEFGYKLHSRSYDDNETLSGTTVNNETRDYDSGKLDLEFYYQALPKTKLFLEVTSADFSYGTDVCELNNTCFNTFVQTLDSTELYVYIGAEWDMTANTQGYAKIGTYSKDFDDDFLVDNDADVSEAAWEIALNWKPLELTEFQFSSASYVDENEGSSIARVVQDYEAAWRQDWIERFYTKLAFQLENIEHKGSAIVYNGNARDDTDTKIKLSAVYNFRRWIDFELDYTMKSRTSNLDGSDITRTINGVDVADNFEYDQNVITLSAKMSL